jgi:6-methylsalicylate decarboxylase
MAVHEGHERTSGLTRRSMLGGTAAALGGAAVMPAVSASGSGAFGDRRGTRIDIHRHMWPPAWAAYRERQGGWAAIGLLTPLPEWTVEDHFAFDAAWGFTASALSLVPPACAFGDVADRRATARAVNEFGAGLIADHGARFAVFGTSSLPDVEGAVTEVRHLFDELHLDGFGVSTNYFGKYIGHPDFAPVYEELNARDAVVLVHPVNPDYPVPGVGFSPEQPFFYPTLEWPFDTARAIGNLIYGEVAKSYPRIRWIFMHTGGTIFSIAFRLATAHAFLPRFNQVLPEGPNPYLERFYFDIAQGFSAAQLRAAKEYVPAQHLLLGTDTSPVMNLYADDNADRVPLPRRELPHAGDPAPGLREVFDARERGRIEGTNALRLLPSLAARIAGDARAIA